MENIKSVQLTQTVQKGGCAAKVAAAELRKILGQVRFPPAPPELMVDTGTFDDAAIYKINADLALVQTLDFFTPIVNTPKLFGRIAAANALSDVYAMGGKPTTAMAIFAFPLATMENEIAIDVLQGASDAITESGAALVGGHTIDDETMKFGLSVTGTVHPDQVWSNAGASPGDVLLLTKALGTGTLTAALKRNEVTEAQIQDGLESMAQLNDVARVLSPSSLQAINAATDITGFGVAGHALNMARASHVSLSLRLADLPVFSQTLEFLEKGFLTKAHRTNAEYVKEQTRFHTDSKILQQLVFDPQTSGGLLLAVEKTKAAQVLNELRQSFSKAAVVGEVLLAGDFALEFR